MAISDNIKKIYLTLNDNIALVAVSKTKHIDDIYEAYNAGQRIFGENRVQELIKKQENLPKDIEWHMIGHLQKNKVKYIAPFIALIHSVDSLELIKEIEKRAKKNNRIIDCLLQIHIAKEETKFGIKTENLYSILEATKKLAHIRIIGLMGMATFTSNSQQIRNEFKSLRNLYNNISKEYINIKVLSMGMSHDYKIAIEENSNMIRIGSAIFGKRIYS